MPSTRTPPTRRQLLQGTALLAASVALPALTQPGRAGSASRSVMVAQLVDYSLGQQDVSKDFLIGSRAAWQEINSRGGVRGRRVEHVSLETDGTPASVQKALATVRDNPTCVVLSGSVGDQMADLVVTQLQKDGVGIAHAAPWLQNSSLDIDEQTFPIFAARQEQIAYALKTLSVMGMSELGAVYATAQDHAAYQGEVERIANGMKLKLESFRGADNLRVMGQQLTPRTPAVLLFVGGTPELAEFTQGLEKQARQRYIVALADVNLQTMQQMGAARNTPVIATQPVPLVNASLPVVRAYRETLARLFDEPPTSLSLAGYIAARYTMAVLAEVEGTPTRQSVLTAFQRRSKVDIGGFLVRFNPQRRSNTYVTQSMITADGRLIG
ncbi:ABC transporter substrate-binding protein [Polaromonas sp.]|uniref:ABC transporter substrate-binding protein n=1 Tax=Polaromonas sp. TaxID=1869339 RepID=UPI0035687BD2